MARLKSIKRAKLSDIEAVQEVLDGKKTIEEAARDMEIEPSILKEEMAKYMPKSSKPSGKHFTSNQYNNNVQKIVSYKGTIREMLLNAKNRHGGTYKLRVVNVYVKPDTERYYEEKVNTIDKESIIKGSSTDHYYPDKALWFGKKSKSESPIVGRKTKSGKNRSKVKLQKINKKTNLRRFNRKK